MFHSSQRSHSVVMQDELNAMEVGPEFDIVSNTAQMVTLVFFAMLYASGLPLLVPVACVTFMAYFGFYKNLILRYYKRPPRVGTGIIETVIGILPYAALLRLMFSAWMLSNNDVLPPTFPVIAASASSTGVSQAGDSSVSSNAYLTFLAHARDHVPDNPSSASLIVRLSQPNIFPLAVLIAVIIVVKVFIKLWPYLPVAWLQWVLKRMYKMCCQHTAKVYVDHDGHVINSVEGYQLLKNNSNGLRQEMAPFTGQYFSYMGSREEIPTSCKDICGACWDSDLSTLTEDEMLNGYVRMDQGKYVVKCKQFSHDSHHHGVHRRKGDLKKTFEVIRDIGCNSYHLKNIPRYRLAWYSLVEGATNVDDYQLQLIAKQKEKEREKQAKARAKAKAKAKARGEDRGDEDGSDIDAGSGVDEGEDEEFSEAPVKALLVDDDDYNKGNYNEDGDLEMAERGDGKRD
jgi:hypothetical protein